MFPFFLLIFCLCLLHNHIQDDGSFILLSRVLEIARSVRETTPRHARKEDNHLVLEYKFGNRLFSVIFPIKRPILWKSAAVCINDVWIDKTAEISYYAGPYKNFYEIPITPKHINSAYEKMGFMFDKDHFVKVKGDECIVLKLKISMQQWMKELKKDLKKQQRF